MRTRGAIAVVVCLLAGGCASSRPAGSLDGGVGQSICPAHPEQCSGTCCGDQCLDTAADPNHCGGCGNRCPSGTICSGGHCGCPPSGAACGMGQTCCGGLGCVSLQSDIRNCGSCGRKCGDGATCDNGTCKCGGVECPTGQTCCNGACAPSCGGMSTPDMADANNGAPAGFCGCADHCANDPLHECVGPNCCYVDAFITQTCSYSLSCAPYAYQ